MKATEPAPGAGKADGTPASPRAPAPGPGGSTARSRSGGDCPECSGTGWKALGADGAGPVRPCGCRDGLRSAVSLADLGVPKIFRDKTLADFEEISAALRRAKKTVGRWAGKYPDVHAGLLLSGPSGVGKTHLAAAALAAIVVERGLAARARFIYLPQLLRTLQRSWSDRSLSEEALLEPLFASEILVLDQLGSDAGSPWVEDRLLYILTRCLNDGVFMIGTTVYPPGDPAAPGPAAPGSPPGVGEEPPFGPRVRARETLGDKITARGVSVLREACQFVEVKGENYRETVLQHGLGYY